MLILLITCTRRDLSRHDKFSSADIASMFVQKLQRRLIRFVWGQRIVCASTPVECFLIIASMGFPRRLLHQVSSEQEEAIHLARGGTNTEIKLLTGALERETQAH